MANDINQVTLIGRLTRDAELKYTASGTAVGKFSIAINRGRKVGDNWENEAHFFDVVLWGRAAEGLQQYLAKGKQIAVHGELRQNRWTDDSGNNHSRVEIHAVNIQLLGGKNDGQKSKDYGTTPENAHQQGQRTPEPVQRDIWDDPAGPEHFEDDIPF